MHKKGDVMNYPVVDMKKTGKRIKELMKLNNIRTRDIVEYMGFESEQSVYKWLRGDSLPKVDNLFALARLFDTPMDNILVERDGEDESPLFPINSLFPLYSRRFIERIIRKNVDMLYLACKDTDIFL